MSKIKLTSARKLILDYLEHTGKHLSAKQIHAEMLGRLPSLNLTTVYCSLDYLVEHNLISVADIGTGSPVYERVAEIPHHHLVCLNCQKIEELEHELVEPFFSLVQEQKGFRIITNHLVLYGTCLDCQ